MGKCAGSTVMNIGPKIIFINVYVQILCLLAKLSLPIYVAHLILEHCQILRS